MKALIITNLLYGSFNPSATLAIHNPYSVSNAIVEVSQYFDFCFIMNDNHRLIDEELLIMPPHNMEGSLDTARMFHIENRIKTPIYFSHKKTFNAIDQPYIKYIINGFDSYCVCGYSGIDILETIAALKSNDKKAFVIEECFGDFNTETKNQNIQKLHKIGLVINKREFNDSFRI